MAMRKAWRRVRHLQGMASKTVRRDQSIRRTRTGDATLTTTELSPLRQRFDASAPFRYRELPASEVPLRSTREHATSLLQEIVGRLDAQGIPIALFRESTAASFAVGLRQEDWGRAAALLTRELGTAIVGFGDTPDASHATYAARSSSDELSRHNLLHVLAPAVTRLRGRVIARYGFETAVRLERWEPTEDGLYSATLWNPVTGLLAEDAFQCGDPARSANASTDPANVITSAVQEGPLAPLQQTALLEVDFPIDVVYTWVDGTDPEWISRKRRALEADSGHGMTEDAAADLRFVAHDELRHSLRSIERYAPWVRHIYLVTDRQHPAWLRKDHPRLTVIDHTDIAPEGTTLPTFNSQAIEANLHRIEGLSEHFLYFNDDVFLSSPVSPELFFNPNGIASMYMSRAHVGPGAPVQGEPASDSAGKNARALVQEIAGKRVSRKLFHTPFALRRSISYEIEERWPEVVASTRDAQFRRIDDVTLSGALHMNYAFATGRAVTRGIRYRYVNVGAPDAAERLAGLEQDRDVLQTFCLNESTQEIEPAVIDSQVRAFLHRRFPDMSSFEDPGTA